MTTQRTSQVTTDHLLVDRALLRAISSKERTFEGITTGSDEVGNPYIQGTILDLRAVIEVMAKDEGVASFGASVFQLANLFSPYGGRLHAIGWQRVLLKVIRGIRTYRFTKELAKR